MFIDQMISLGRNASKININEVLSTIWKDPFVQDFIINLNTKEQLFSRVFHQTYEDRDFRQRTKSILQIVHNAVKELLESGVLSKSATEEAHSYYYALDKFLKSQSIK